MLNRFFLAKKMLEIFLQMVYNIFGSIGYILYPGE